MKTDVHTNGIIVFLVAALAGALAALALPGPAEAAQQPRVHVYREIDGRKLEGHVFQPPGEGAGKPAAAILLFHGGGWSEGSAEWTFGDARRSPRPSGSASA